MNEDEFLQVFRKSMVSSPERARRIATFAWPHLSPKSIEEVQTVTAETLNERNWSAALQLFLIKSSDQQIATKFVTAFVGLASPKVSLKSKVVQALQPNLLRQFGFSHSQNWVSALRVGFRKIRASTLTETELAATTKLLVNHKQWSAAVSLLISANAGGIASFSAMKTLVLRGAPTWMHSIRFAQSSALGFEFQLLVGSAARALIRFGEWQKAIDLIPKDPSSVLEKGALLDGIDAGIRADLLVFKRAAQLFIPKVEGLGNTPKEAAQLIVASQTNWRLALAQVEYLIVNNHLDTLWKSMKFCSWSSACCCLAAICKRGFLSFEIPTAAATAAINRAVFSPVTPSPEFVAAFGFAMQQSPRYSQIGRESALSNVGHRSAFWPLALISACQGAKKPDRVVDLASHHGLWAEALRVIGHESVSFGRILASRRNWIGCLRYATDEVASPSIWLEALLSSPAAHHDALDGIRSSMRTPISFEDTISMADNLATGTLFAFKKVSESTESHGSDLDLIAQLVRTLKERRGSPELQVLHRIARCGNCSVWAEAARLLRGENFIRDQEIQSMILKGLCSTDWKVALDHYRGARPDDFSKESTEQLAASLITAEKWEFLSLIV
jgi:hypothetical protein